MLSWRNDRHHGQWLVLHVPFRRITELVAPEVDAKVPRPHRFLAHALRCPHPVARAFWQDEAKAAEEMKREGHKKKYIEDVMRQLRADVNLVHSYLDGRLVKTAADDRSVEEAGVLRHFQLQYRYEEDLRAGTKTVEGRLNTGEAARVAAGDAIVLGTTHVRVINVTYHESFRELLQHHGIAATLPRVRSLQEGVRVYHGFRGYERGALEYGVVAWEVAVEEARQGLLAFEDLNAEQRQYVTRLRAARDHAFAVRDAPDEATAQALIDADKPKVEVCFGPPGTGKTAATLMVIEETLSLGGRVLFSVYTAQLASRMRERFANHPQKALLRIDTCHAAFALGEDFVATPVLSDYQLIVIDEVSQLTGELNDRILQLRNFVDDVPAMAEMGDRWQMAGFGDQRPWDTRLWRQSTHTTRLHQPYRFEDQDWYKLLSDIRTAKPAGEVWTRLMRTVLRKQKAWRGHEPTVEDIRYVLNTHPDTTLLAISREGAGILDDLALQAKYPRRAPLVVLPGDVESYPANYDANGRLKSRRQLTARPVPIHRGMPLYMTRNMRKDLDYVNGMRCVIEDWDAAAEAVVVKTSTGRRVAVTLCHDEDLGFAYFPLRPGYASTIMKFQGAELPHVTVWLDKPHCPAAAYTAMSRVKRRVCCLLGGILNPNHFTPAR